MVKTNWPETLRLWFFTFFKIPMIFSVRPKVLELNAKSAVICIPLKRYTKNHLRSMYFGALCIGADLAAGIHMMFYMRGRLSNLSFAFKDLHAEYLKRPEADVHFTCTDGEAINNVINKTKETKERENIVVNVIATTPSISQDTPVARFALTLSVKHKI